MSTLNCGDIWKAHRVAQDRDPTSQLLKSQIWLLLEGVYSFKASGLTACMMKNDQQKNWLQGGTEGRRYEVVRYEDAWCSITADRLWAQSKQNGHVVLRATAYCSPCKESNWLSDWTELSLTLVQILCCHLWVLLGVKDLAIQALLTRNASCQDCDSRNLCSTHN